MKKTKGTSQHTGKGNPLGYALNGQMTVRPYAHGGRAKLSTPTGIYHGPHHKKS